MNKTVYVYGTVLVMSLAVIGMPGCSKNPYNLVAIPSLLKGWRREGQIVLGPVSAAFRTPAFSRMAVGFGASTRTLRKSEWVVARC
ncbi:MAG: hypothetical protein ABIO96_10770, partial [Nitrospiraceae bacterium]